jgi:uncharacterized protein (TIGR02453 family)
MSHEFQGFPADTMTFLKELAANNDRAWFDAHRRRYERSLKKPAEDFVSAIAPALERLDPSVRAEPRVNGSIFRINRDTRFSKDKRPYKEELAFRFPTGSKSEGSSGFFMRIRPGIVGFAAGVWAFPGPALERFRESVADDTKGAALDELMDGLQINGCAFTAASYKRVPKPWQQDHPRGDLLRMKGLLGGVEQQTPASLNSPEFTEWCAQQFSKLEPLHAWLRANA